MARTVLGLVRASHPEPAVAVTVVAGLLALGLGHPVGGITAVIGTVLASQLAVGWVNDRLDAGRDILVGRSDKPLVTGAVGRRTVTIAAVLAVLVTPTLALATTNRTAAGWATLGLVSALLYDWPLKATPLSVLPYAVSFGTLPAFVVSAAPGQPTPPTWLVGAGALLGAGAHFANALPDLADDLRTGVRGLPHRCGTRGSLVAAAVLLLAATVVLVTGPPGAPSWLGAAAITAAALVPPLAWYAARRLPPAEGRTTVVFRAVMLVALLDVVLLLVTGRVG